MGYFPQQVILCTTGVHNQLAQTSILRNVKGFYGYKIQTLQTKE